MAEKGLSSDAIVWICVLFLFIIVYISIFIVFFEGNYWWIFPVMIYMIYFFIRDLNLKRNEVFENLRIKDRREIRISFWN